MGGLKIPTGGELVRIQAGQIELVRRFDDPHPHHVFPHVIRRSPGELAVRHQVIGKHLAISAAGGLRVREDVARANQIRAADWRPGRSIP